MNCTLFYKAPYFLDINSKYSIVKDSNADLGVNFKIVQNRPTVKAVWTRVVEWVYKAPLCFTLTISDQKNREW